MRPTWQITLESLRLVAERGASETLAQIAVLKALNQHGVATPAPQRNSANVFRIVR